MNSVRLGFVILAFAIACGSTPERGAIDLDGMDRDVKPGDDFFMYANGGWVARTEIPADRRNWGTGPILTELTNARIAELIQESARNAAAGSEAAKIGDFYSTYLDEAAIDAKGIAPLKPTLDRIAAIKDARGLAREIGASIRADVDAFNNTDFETPNLFGLWVAQDVIEPTRYSPFLMQGGLGLPNRSYYLDASPPMSDARVKYEAHLAKLLHLAGQPDADGKAKRSVELETRIASVHATREENVDVQRGKNRWTRADFDTRAPGLDWTALFAAAGLESQKNFVVWQPEAIAGIANAGKTVPLATWKDWLAARAVERAAPLLPRRFADEHFAFYGGVLGGTPAPPERWKAAIDATTEAMGQAIGRLYVERYFPSSEKERAQQLVDRLVAAFARRLDALDWMQPETRQRARAKLATLKVEIGYPETWRDYSMLEVVKGDALGNAERASMFEYRRNLARLARPVDRGEWVINPQLVNAINMPAMNAIGFPAAILQPPYFDRNRPSVMDYGAIGAVIGHEISHSFDDQGAQFDATGRLENWWSHDDFAHFTTSATKLVDQFNAYRPFPDLAVNGKLTLSENIADLAGLAIAYDAYRLAYGGREAQTAQGFTGDQQFFLSFAQIRRGTFREAMLRRMILTDGHAPTNYRANTVRNLDPWYTAFAPRPEEKLYLAPGDRVRLW